MKRIISAWVSALLRLAARFLPSGTKRGLLARLAFRFVKQPRLLLRNLNTANALIYYFRTTQPDVLARLVDGKLGTAAGRVSSRLSAIPDPYALSSPDDIDELVFVLQADPIVSIIIPIYNQWQYTYNCLRSILHNTQGISYEVVIGDDCSSDQTADMLKKTKGITVVSNPRNLGFVRNCNKAAQSAHGRFLVFLNNDTYVTGNWLVPLLQIVQDDDMAGIVGPNVVSPDGTLLENGWMMDVAGWGQPIGRGQLPTAYQHSYVKEVDCVTGVCLLVRKDAFEMVGQFSEAFAPAFYDEFDLAFAIREVGYKVILQPKSLIVHYGSASYGPEERDRLSSVNHQKFVEKWKGVLPAHPPDGRDFFLARDRSFGKKVVLVVDDKVPDYDRHAGSLTIYQYVGLFCLAGFKVIFLPDNLDRLEPYAGEMQQMGVEVIYGAFDFDSWIRSNGSHLDLVWLSRPDVSIKYIDRIRRNSEATILYYVHDLHFLREQRRYEVEKDRLALSESQRVKRVEFEIFGKADVVLTPSSSEKDILSKALPEKRIEVIPPYMYDHFPADASDTPLDARKDLIFLGGFGHLPNVDGVLWFVKEIFPGILRHLPDVRFFIVGSDPPESLKVLASDRIIVTGFVTDLSPFFDTARVFVSPLRYGAGVKGKIITSMCYGVPVVTTTVGNEGIGLVDGEEAMTADDPDSFAEKVVELYSNRELWDRISRNSVVRVKRDFSRSTTQRRILSILGIPDPTVESAGHWRDQRAIPGDPT
jgi:GT2 family glycosyltransferase/glycosyltransferase involved in cell wall biosynthesis